MNNSSEGGDYQLCLDQKKIILTVRFFAFLCTEPLNNIGFSHILQTQMETIRSKLRPLFRALSHTPAWYWCHQTF